MNDEKKAEQLDLPGGAMLEDPVEDPVDRSIVVVDLETKLAESVEEATEEESAAVWATFVPV